tara:strand:- start:3822 stop:4352 length:531 start_codon:yes stop_codon:yes gene_type:complete
MGKKSLYILEGLCGSQCYRPVKLSKIGVANNVVKRVKSHSNNNAIPIECKRYFDADGMGFEKQTALTIEKMVKKKFSDYRAHDNTNEWFKKDYLVIEDYVIKILMGEIPSKGGQIANSREEVMNKVRDSYKKENDVFYDALAAEKPITTKDVVEKPWIQENVFNNRLFNCGKTSRI